MPLKIFKRGEVWHYRGTVAGRRLRGSTGASAKDIAARVAAEIEAREWKGRLDGPSAVLTFAQAALLYRKAGKSTRFLEKIEDYWKNTRIKDITPGAIITSARELYPRVSGATRNRQVIIPTQAIINHAADSELCPYIRVKRFKTETKIKDPADLAWVEAFMAEATPQLGALALFMFLTGARISEALAVTWGDLNLRAKTALIRQTKIGADRKAHLPMPLVVAIGNIPRLNSRPVFFYRSRKNMVRIWRVTAKRAGIDVLSPHCCRHGFATALLRAGVDAVTVAKLGGWKSARHVLTTYGHALNDPTLTDKISGTTLTHSLTDNSKNARKIRASSR